MTRRALRKLVVRSAFVVAVAFLAAAFASVGCGTVLSVTVDDDASTTSPPALDGSAVDGDAGADAQKPPITRCSDDAGFETPKLVTTFQEEAGIAVYAPRLTADERFMVFTVEDTVQSRRDVGEATRSDIDQPFTSEVRSLTSPGVNTDPAVSPDGLELVYGSMRAHSSGATGGIHLWRIVRPSRADVFEGSAAEELPTTDALAGPKRRAFRAADGLWFTRIVASQVTDVHFAANTSGGFGAAEAPAFVGLPSGAVLGSPVPSADGLSLYLAVRTTTVQRAQIHVSRRSSTSDAWGFPAPVTELGSSSDDGPGFLSTDNCRLYFESSRGGPSRIYVATKPRPGGT